MNSKKMTDSYEQTFRDYKDLLSDVVDTEDESAWISGVPVRDLAIRGVDAILASMENTDSTEDAVVPEVGLAVKLADGSDHYLRRCALPSLYERVNLFGSALGRMSSTALAEVLNNAIAVARGKAMVLARYGKIAALHSDAEGNGYCIMPISELLDITERSITRQFGKPVFIGGYNSHEYTEAFWILPAVKDEFCDLYNNSLSNAISSFYKMDDLVPAVRFSSSDTASSSATLQPLYMTPDNKFIRFCDGIRVRHIRRDKDTNGCEKFEELIEGQAFARFNEGADAVKRLSETEIRYPENVVVGICNKLQIPKKYGETAREKCETFMLSASYLSAFDVFMALSEAISSAAGVSRMAQVTMEERLFSLLSPQFDWTEYDIGGVVAWGK